METTAIFFSLDAHFVVNGKTATATNNFFL